MNLKVIFLCGFMPFCARMFSMEKHSPSMIQRCWRHGHYTKREAKLSFEHNNELLPGKNPWRSVQMDALDKRVKVWCEFYSSTHLESSVSQTFLLDTLQEPQEHSFFEDTPKGLKMVTVVDTGIQVARGFQTFEHIPARKFLFEGVLIYRGQRLTFGEFCCIPAQVCQEQHLYVFMVTPFTYLADVGVYDLDDPICYTMSSDGSTLVVLSKDASVHVFEVAPHFQRHPLLSHQKMAKLRNCSFRFAQYF